MFRKLREDEIECKVALVKQNGVQILLYKTARTDMDLLDEVFTPMNWECEYKEIKGNLYCGISVIDEKGNKVTKWDCGVESAFGDKEKGEASDAFKRAGFKWGIGRELYSAPFVWIPADKLHSLKEYNGRVTCNDKFSVERITYTDDGKIDGLSIVNDKNERVFVKMPTKKGDN